MKDAYSFDVTDEGLAQSYQAQRDAYERIFQRLGVEYAVVKADAGAMGGSKSEEFLNPSPIGEDTFVRSKGGFAANVEAVKFAVAEDLDGSKNPAAVVHDSPNTPTIASLVDYSNASFPKGDGQWAASDTLKNVVLALIAPDGKRELVIVGVPGDREVDQKRAEAFFGPNEVEAANEEDFAKHPLLVKGYIGPVKDGVQLLGKDAATGIRYLLDPRVAKGSQWITGANVDQKHVYHLTYGRDFSADGVADIAEIREGDPAPDGSGPLELARGIEIGHVFQLGRKYAEALGLQVLDENGKLVTVTMGSYGIGVTRLVAVIAEASHDENGLIWPESVAPADLHIIAAGKDELPFEAAEALAKEAEKFNLSVILDDRAKVSPGVKFADAELIGVPWIIICGRGVAEGEVELWNRRSGERVQVKLDSAIAELLAKRA
jgi:prolyl-tRNA synthetase